MLSRIAVLTKARDDSVAGSLACDAQNVAVHYYYY